MLMGCFETAASGVIELPRGVAELSDVDWIRRPGLLMTGSGGASASAPSGAAVTWDGRLDNRREWPHCAPHSSDAAIALAAFERVPECALERLIGDWRAAFWDATNSTVVLASDYSGARPIYYHRARQRVTWSSSLSYLASRVGAVDLDETYIAEFLRGGGSATRTPYQGIFAVPPGHAVRVSRPGMASSPFWRPFPQPVRMSAPRDYARRLFELFEEAVTVRLQASGTIFAELSGGLDSSAVVCMAHRLIRDGLVPARRLFTVHYLEDGSPDRRYQQSLEKMLGIESLCLDTAEHRYLVEGSAGGGLPMGWESRWLHLARKMQDAGAGVFLTGRLGDLVMGNFWDDSEQVADLVRALAPLKACSEALAWSRVIHEPVYSVIARALRRSLTASWREEVNAEDSLSGELRKRMEAESRTRTGQVWCGLAPGIRKRWRMLSNALASGALQTPEHFENVSYTHPYAHRPLVEYMLSIPPSVVCGPGQPRKLMRAAFAELLPPAVLARRSKASFQKVFRSALEPLAASLLRSPEKIQVISRGWIDRRSLTGRLDRFLRGLDCNESQLRHIILLELWLRGRESQKVDKGVPEWQVPIAS